MQKQKNKFKILFTGGHAATTAEAVVEEIVHRKLPLEIYWIGSRYAMEGKNVETLEYKTLPNIGVKFLPLITGRLQRKFTFWTIPSLIKIPIGFFHSLYYLLTVRPDITLSFGGYSAFPVVIISRILGIRVVIHEQTAAAGRSNIASSKFADVVALAREQSVKYFPPGKTAVVGNPVSRKMLAVSKKNKLSAKPAIFVTGGSRGSQIINSALEEILPVLLQKYLLVHQTGDLDYDKFLNLQKSLPRKLSKNYEVFSSVNHENMPEYFAKADLIIARAGANTVSDIMAASRPSILVPLAISFLDEQTKNALFLQKHGFAKIIKQSELNPAELKKEIDSIFSRYNEIMSRVNKFESPDKNAAKKLTDILLGKLK